MPPSLAEIVTASNGRLLHLHFDFDGTLVPIHPDPDHCQLDPELQRRLGQLLEHPGLELAVLSGRSLRDLDGRLGVLGITTAGNHGLEISSRGRLWRHPDAVALRPKLQQVAQQANLLLAEIPGTMVEDKRLSLSLHHRRVPASWAALLQTRMMELEASLGEGGELFCRHGHQVLEILPRLDWTKASAARLLLSRAGSAANPPYFYAGDDVSDEDVFTAFPHGITLKIGPDHKPSTARYRLDSTALLRQWLLEPTPR